MDAIRLSPPRRLSLPVANRWGAGEMNVLDFGDPDRPVDLIFVHANGFNAMTYRSLLARSVTPNGAPVTMTSSTTIRWSCGGVWAAAPPARTTELAAARRRVRWLVMRGVL